MDTVKRETEKMQKSVEENFNELSDEQKKEITDTLVEVKEKLTNLSKNYNQKFNYILVTQINQNNELNLNGMAINAACERHIKIEAAMELMIG